MTGRSKADLERSAALIEQARQRGLGPYTKLKEARQAARDLHLAGCSIVSIAGLFEISPEQARMWVRAMATHPLTDEEWQLVQYTRKHRLDPQMVILAISRVIAASEGDDT